MSKVPLWQKLASIEADLVSAAALGPVQLQAEAFKKFAQLDLSDPDDLDAVLDGVMDVTDEIEAKTAGVGDPVATPNNALRNVALGALLAGPVMTAGKYFMNKYQKERGWDNLSAHSPEMVGPNPERARMIYDLLHDVSPNIARNTPLASDLTNQMMSMPQIDLGTVQGLSNVAKNFRPNAASGGGITGALKDVPGVMMGADALMKQSNLMVRPTHMSTDGVPCLFNWGSKAAKTAGLTDAFSGNGLPIDQANNAFTANQNEMGNTLLPLDTVVRELLAKEQELSQREEMVQQQEMQLQEAIQAVQQMGSLYQQESGVDPNTGEPAAPAQAADGAPAQEAPAEGAAPAPAEEEAPAEEGAPAEEMPPEAQAGAEAGEPPMSQDESVDEMQNQEDQGASPQEAAQAMGEGNFEGAQNAESAAALQGGEEAPKDEASEGGESAEGGEGGESEDDDSEGGEEGGSEEGGEAPAEGGESPAEGGEEAPAEDVPPQLPLQLSPEEEAAAGQTMAEQTQPMPPADENPAGGESAPPTEEETAPAEGDVPAEGASDEAPNTPESIEGSAEDEAHDAITGEDTPEDEAADAGLAEELNQAGQAPTPAGGDVAGSEVAPEAGAGPEEIPAAPAAPMAPAADGSVTKTITIPIPITVSLKIAEADKARAERAEAFEKVQSVMADMFRP